VTAISKFNVKEKIMVVEKKNMEAETVVSNNYEIDLNDVQVLLNKNQSLVMNIDFVASMFHLEQKKHLDSI
jgi:hypothetical protein